MGKTLDFNPSKIAEGFGLTASEVNHIFRDARALSNVIEFRLYKELGLKFLPPNSPLGDLIDEKTWNLFEVRCVTKHGVKLGYSSKARNNGTLGWRAKIKSNLHFIFVDITQFPQCPFCVVHSEKVEDILIESCQWPGANSGKVTYEQFWESFSFNMNENEEDLELYGLLT